MRELSATASIAPGVGVPQQIEAFAARLRSRWLRGLLCDVALRVALPFLLLALSLLWWWTEAAAVVAAVGAVVLAGALGRAALQARRAPPLHTLGDLEQLEQGRVLTDELATWLEVARGGRQRAAPGEAAMAGWLGEQIALELPHVPVGHLHASGHRRLGRMRYLLPLLVLLLLAWLLLALLPPIPGLLGGGAGGGSGGGAGAGSGAAAGSAGGTQDPTDPGAGLPMPPPEPPPPEPPTPEAEPPPPEPPAPILDLPAKDNLIVPQFVGDGEVRKALARTALLEVGGGAPPPDVPRAGGTGDANAPPPLPTTAEFARAAERAQAARHVPPEEAPMVQRFFHLLREAAK